MLYNFINFIEVDIYANTGKIGIELKFRDIYEIKPYFS
jgi:hypothetical protein